MISCPLASLIAPSSSSHLASHRSSLLFTITDICLNIVARATQITQKMNDKTNVPQLLQGSSNILLTGGGLFGELNHYSV